MKPAKADDIRGNWATLLLSWNRDGSLDAPSVSDEIDLLAGFGVDGIYAHGTAGEFHALTDDEFDQISSLLAARCERAGVPFQIGVGHMSAQISLARLQRTVPLAPAAFQVVLPDWFPVSDIEATDFLSHMAEVAEGIGLVLYNPPHAKRVLAPETIGRIAREVPALVGVKMAGGDEAWYAAMREHMNGLSVFVPGHHLATGCSRGAHGSYSNVACLNPAAAQTWWNQMQTDLPAAMETEKRIRMFMDEHIAPFITKQGYCNGACDRLLALIGDWTDIGDTMRWPYRSIPRAEAKRLRPIARQLLPEFFAAQQ
jgi:4-hydroxy-tetrahydrodipicolinate synthase